MAYGIDFFLWSIDAGLRADIWRLMEQLQGA